LAVTTSVVDTFKTNLSQMAKRIVQLGRESKRVKGYDKIDEMLKVLDNSVEDIETPNGKSNTSYLC
jgi:hypothetical protein